MKNKIKNLIDEINNLTYDEYIYLVDDLQNLENSSYLVITNPLYTKCGLCNWISHSISLDEYSRKCINCGGWAKVFSEDIEDSFKRVEQGIEVEIPEETTPQYFKLDDTCPFFLVCKSFRKHCEERPLKILRIMEKSSKHTFSADIHELATKYKIEMDIRSEEHYQWSLKNDVMYQPMNLGISGSYE